MADDPTAKSGPSDEAPQGGAPKQPKASKPAKAPEPTAASAEPDAEAGTADEPLEPDAADAEAGSNASVTSVNSQITDAVTQANTTVLGAAPGFAMALVYQSLAQAMGLAFLNATQQQQQANMIAQAATAAAVARILGGEAVAEVSEEGGAP